MAFTPYDSQLSVFKITDTGAVLRDVSSYIVSVEGLPGPRELNEATTLNQAGRKWHTGLQNVLRTSIRRERVDCSKDRRAAATRRR